jgi:hypothetical protein
MTTKDWIYLGLIVLTGVAFYCNGYYAGVWRSRKVFETLLDEIEASRDPDNEIHHTLHTELDSFLGRTSPDRPIHAGNPGGRLPEDFRNN